MTCESCGSSESSQPVLGERVMTDISQDCPFLRSRPVTWPRSASVSSPPRRFIDRFRQKQGASLAQLCSAPWLYVPSPSPEHVYIVVYYHASSGSPVCDVFSAYLSYLRRPSSPWQRGSLGPGNKTIRNNQHTLSFDVARFIFNHQTCRALDVGPTSQRRGLTGVWPRPTQHGKSVSCSLPPPR